MKPTGPPVLFVEDDPGDIELFQLVFQDAGGKAEFSIATTGLQAMNLLQRLAAQPAEELPRFALLDLNLPLIHGYDILAFMKAEPNLRHIPVAVLTTSDAPLDRERCNRLGCTAYLVKPRDLRGYRDLARVVVRILSECSH